MPDRQRQVVAAVAIDVCDDRLEVGEWRSQGQEVAQVTEAAGVGRRSYLDRRAVCRRRAQEDEIGAAVAGHVTSQRLRSTQIDRLLPLDRGAAQPAAGRPQQEQRAQSRLGRQKRIWRWRRDDAQQTDVAEAIRVEVARDHTDGGSAEIRALDDP